MAGIRLPEFVLRPESHGAASGSEVTGLHEAESRPEAQGEMYSMHQNAGAMSLSVVHGARCALSPSSKQLRSSWQLARNVLGRGPHWPVSRKEGGYP